MAQFLKSASLACTEAWVQPVALHPRYHAGDLEVQASPGYVELISDKQQTSTISIMKHKALTPEETLYRVGQCSATNDHLQLLVYETRSCCVVQPGC